MAAQIFNIQKFSIQDGPGIRTTVFFQGCPLECAWCHNPEGKVSHRVLLFHPYLCKKCFMCYKACPERAIIADPDSESRIDRSRCNLCMRCAAACPYGGLSVSGGLVDLDAIFKEASRDTDFYRNSNGGVTASGGEPLMQHEAVIDLFARCRDRGIHTALDTSGYAAWEILEKTAAVTDMFLYDLKGVDRSKHIEWTGVDNKIILSNLRRLAELRPGSIRIRIPFIPGFNTDPEDVQGMADLVARLPVQGVDVLPYHNFAEAKYRALDLEYAPRLRGLPDYDFKMAEEVCAPLKAAVRDFTVGG